jgi:hypothetical protein
MTDAYMMERVMVALDRGTSPFVTMTTFAKALSLYLRGGLEEKISYAFTVRVLIFVYCRSLEISYLICHFTIIVILLVFLLSEHRSFFLIETHKKKNYDYCF